MTDEKKCPSCGAPVEASASDCPSCGASMSDSRNAPTIMASAPLPVSRFPTGAAALDEVKRLIREGNKSEAVKVHREHFQTSLKESKEAVEVLASDMPHQPAPARPQAAKSASPGPSAAAFETPKEQSDAWKKWVIGCSIAFIVFCCLCLILTISLGLIPVLGV
jgi:hypothetical protein